MFINLYLIPYKLYSFLMPDFPDAFMHENLGYFLLVVWCVTEMYPSIATGFLSELNCVV